MSAAILKDWDNLVQSSFKSVPDLPKFSWEREGMAKRVLKPDYRTHWERNIIEALRPPKVPRVLIVAGFEEQIAKSNAEVAKLDKLVMDRSCWGVVAKRLSGVAWDSHEVTGREAALKKWKHILGLVSNRSNLGRMLLTDIIQLKDDHHLREILNTVFSNKATLTLHKRADSLMRLFEFCKLTGRELAPVDPGVVYLCMNTVGMAKPGAAQSVREALNFAHGTIGLAISYGC